MTYLVIGLSLLLFAPAACAEEIVRDLTWDRLSQGGRVVGGEVLPPAGAAAFTQLRVENAQGQPRIVPVLVIESPAISGARYAITGQVRYEGVEGDGYLEM